MNVHLALILLSTVPTDPLSAFEANFARARVSVHYSFEVTTTSGDVLDHLWRSEDPRLDLGRTSLDRIDGEWAFDGTSEYDAVGSAVGPWFHVRQGPSQTIFDSTTWAHAREVGSVVAQKAPFDNPSSPALSGFGPFRWSPTDPKLDWFLRSKFSGIAPERSKSIQHGRPLDVEIYSKKEEIPANLECDINLRCEVHYDPALGHQPRIVRYTSLLSNETQIHLIEKQFHLVECRGGPAGGLVPADYYVV
jgi:hypothetical protein